MELGDTFGALLVGIFISAILFGVTNLQVFMYFKSVLDALQLALSFHVAYWNLIVNYFDPPDLLRLPWSFKCGAVGVPNLMSVHVLTWLTVDKAVNRGKRIRGVMPITVAIFTCAGYAMIHLLAIRTWIKSDSTLRLLGEKWVTYYPLSTWFGVDVAIAGCMSFLLFRSRTGYRRTDSMITVLMLFTLSTGVITSLCSLSAIATMAALPKTFIVAAVEFSLTKLYVNSFMAMLNVRSSLRTPNSTDDRESPNLVPSNRLQNDSGSTISNDIPTSPSLPTTDMHRTEDTRFHHRNAQVPDEVHLLGRVDHQSPIKHANTASTWAKAQPLHSDVV
ncbi:uncharacterized protein LAESUDRAFT_721753 [Laetiporus sulphureus 93-53]|uniref:DUF6534 domain-containing protein n=1 Tax=Laetiporus sulphureus 93-53 TaxID=1314785 RepID=A0A165GIM0_9APHY|nr:uncharacterized protein LAESUDRAFT_721753 [Laetiporus sulphureus 93-53]KZT10398.1 hypothetical protein LAESUDRAFT_721753 [Laetiporus sulphureus 93-53]